MPGANFEQANAGETTPDGQPISGWWRRFFARLVDGIILGLLSLVLIPIAAPDLMDTFDDFFTLLSDSTIDETQVNAVVETLAVQIGRLSLVSAVLSIIYEAVFLKVASATPGKMLLGLRVRLRDQPGPLGWSTSAIRALIWHGPSLLGIIPLLGNIAGLIPIVNGLWPLWDAKNQSLNDKVAKTNVVRKA